MQWLKKIFDFYINSSLHVSVAVTTLAAITFYNFEVPIKLNLLAFIFFGSITGYNFVKYAGIAGLHHLSLTPNLRVIQLFSLLAFLGVVYFTFKQTWTVIIISALLGLFTTLYVLPIFAGNRNLRGLPGTKIFVISLVWAGATVLLPIAEEKTILPREIILCFLQRFSLIFAIILPFDIRDLRFDMANLGTIPQRLGVRKTRILGILMLCGVVLLEFLKNDQTLEISLSILITCGIAMVLVRYSKIRQSKYYASFWVEGIPILWGVLLLFFAEIIG